MADKLFTATGGFLAGVTIQGTTFGGTTATSLGPKYEYTDPAGYLIGSRYPRKCRRTLSKLDVSGTVTVDPSYNELLFLLSLIAPGSGYTLVDDPTTFTKTVYTYDGRQYWQFPACRFNTLELSGSGTDPVSAQLSILGTTRGEGGQTGTPEGAAPVMMAGVEITIGSDRYRVADFTTTLTHNMKEDGFRQSVTRNQFLANLFSASGSFALDWNPDSLALVKNYYGTNTSASLAFRFVAGAQSVTVTFPEAVFTGDFPENSPENEVSPTVNWTAYAPESEAMMIISTAA